MKDAGIHRFDHVLAQHHVVLVDLRNNDAMAAVQATGLADVEEAFDLFVDAADGLHLAVLVHRAGDRQGLAQGRVTQKKGLKKGLL